MRTKDYEEMIDSLSCGIIIDEMVLNKGHVKTVYGHTESVFLRWDELGRGFSIHRSELTDPNVECEKFEDSFYARDVVYDLKF